MHPFWSYPYPPQTSATSRWHQCIFHRDYRPRKMRCLPCNPITFTCHRQRQRHFSLEHGRLRRSQISHRKLPVPAVKTGHLHPALRAVSRFSVNNRMGVAHKGSWVEPREESKKNTIRMDGVSFWLPLLGSNQRHCG